MKQKNSCVKKGVIVKTMISLLILILMVGCVGKGDISKAILIGYESKPFEEVMKKVAMNEFKDNEEISSVSYGWSNGWEGKYAPDTGNLRLYEAAMSYVISTDLEDEGETESNRCVFYMIHNTIDNTLSVQGGVIELDGEVAPGSKSEVRELVEYLYDEYY